jgi:hypothetical protein
VRASMRQCAGKDTILLEAQGEDAVIVEECDRGRCAMRANVGVHQQMQYTTPQLVIEPERTQTRV